MKLMRKKGIRLVAGLLLAGIAVTTGCSAPMDTGYSGPANAPNEPGDVLHDSMPAPAAPRRAPEYGEGDDRMIARTSSIRLVVDDIEVTAKALREVAARLKGSVTAESLSLPEVGNYGSSHVEVTVPAAQLDEALALMAELGRVTDRRIDSQDVTDEVVDVDARVRTMQESIKRLQELMSQTGSIADIARVESELTQRQADLESLLSRQKSLSQRVATTPISVELRTVSAVEPLSNSGFLSGLLAGWGVMVDSAVVAITVIGALLPWLALTALILGPIIVVRRSRRNSAAKAATPVPPTEN
ncbi:MAG: DUF4349 domain-containing protein [Propionibacteriaceae bacterium]|nr:DUF4349 domain-containing protein [Propionibacteriaceae bacterium]